MIGFPDDAVSGATGDEDLVQIAAAHEASQPPRSLLAAPNVPAPTCRTRQSTRLYNLSLTLLLANRGILRVTVVENARFQTR